MKTKISRIGKKSLSVIIALMIIVSTMFVGMVSVSAATFTSGTKIYLDVTKKNDWASSGYIYMYMYGTGDASWAKMTKVTGETYIYEGTVPDGTDDSNIIFLRNTEDIADWKQDRQTIDITTYNGVKNMYVLSATDSDKKFGATYKQQGEWDTYSGSTTNEYTVTYGSNNDSLGTVTATVVSGTKVVENNEVTFTATPTGSNEFKGWYSDPSCTKAISGAEQSSTTYTTKITQNTTVYAKFEAPTSSDTITVYFKNTNNWSKVYCYAWYTDGTDKNTTKAWPGDTMNLIDSTNKVYSIELPGNSTKCIFNPGDNNGKTTNLTIEAGKIYVYESSNTNKTTWDDYGSTPSGNYKLTDKSGNYGKVVFTVNGNTVTRANEGDEVTATVTPNTGFDFVADSFSVTNDTSKEAVGKPTGTTLTFKMPASDVTATAKFALNKAEYVKTLKDGLYVDVAPDKNDTTATFVKWNNYTGSGQNPSSGVAPHNTKEVYTLYLPANVNLNSVTLYNAFDSNITFGSITIDANSSKTVSLSTGTEYSFTVGSTPYKFNVMQGSTSSMFLYTNDGKGNDYNLPTSKKSYDKDLLDKETIKASGGLCTTIKTKKSEDGTVTHTLSDALDLSQVKGRGNSSWKASCQIFGKYAFNMKLSSATSLFDLPKSKSFCLLANNMDYSMLRNAYIYQLAKDIGLYDSPEFEFVDIYDNGEYMGAYLVTEKVDVGIKDKLIKGTSIEKLNEDKGAVFDEEHLVHSDTLGYATIKSGPDLDNDTEFKNTYQTTGTYLLEFEIDERYKNEPSYFVSTQGQHVVLKNPEFATKGEVEFIRDKFNEMEALVYPENNAKIDLEALSKVMDLDSFARMYLIQEFTSNLDSAATSYYITYDCSKGLFVASPVWDYDMALGQNSGTKKAMDGSDLTANNAEYWFAKLKAMGKGDDTKKYSLQSKLATDSNFQKVIKKVWFGKNNDGFYDKVKPYYANDGQLDKWLAQVLSSYNMNEARWQFIQNRTPGKWSAPDTTNNNGFNGAVDFLKTSWSNTRGTWLNEQFNGYNDYTQIATPTLTAYASDGETALTGTVTAGDTYVLKATTPEIYVDYVLYDGETKVDENSDGVFTISNATAGIHSYTVKTVYNTTNEKTSSAVPVTVSGTVSITDVSISTPKTQVNVDEEFTLTATASPNGLTGVTYTFYKDGTAIPEATNITSNTYKTKFTAEGTAVYKVKATLNDKTVESETVTVTAKTASVKQDVTIYFKTATAPAYAPSVSFDGGNALTMSDPATSDVLGKDYSGALTFAWYSVTINDVDTTKTHTLTFTSKRTKLNATWSGKLTSTNRYFTADNLMRDTVAVNLTGESEVKRNFFYSATNMVFDSTDAKNKTLGFTVVGGVRVKMGTKVDESGATVTPVSAPTVKSATYIQMVNASMITVSSLQSELYDVNFDGKVDIKDATYIQYALAS